MVSEQPQCEPLLPPKRFSGDPVSRARLLCLTCGIAGLQVVFSVLLSNGSPFPVSLGLSQTITALVWFAAPFSSSLVQPLVGSWSDRIASRWGRRRPFIFSGAVGITIFMILLAWSPSIFGYTEKTTTDQPSSRSQGFIVSFVTTCLLALYISIQLVQAGVRSLIVECLPKREQARGSKYAGTMQALGNVLGYLFGFLIIPAICPVTMSPFQAFSLFSTVVLCISTAVTCSVIKEKEAYGLEANAAGGSNVFRTIKTTYDTMPITIKQVCHIQFLSWMGWFPLLFYATTYVGEFYDRNLQIRERHKHQHNHIVEIREVNHQGLSNEAIRQGTFAAFLFALVTLIGSIILPRVLQKVLRGNAKANIQTNMLLRTWGLSHFLFAGLMLLTLWQRNARLATLLIAAAGIAGAVTMFAPFAIINIELGSMHDRLSGDASDMGETVASRNELQLGTIMAIHNMSISLPQPVGALLSSGIGWVLRGGGIIGLIAAIMTWRLEQSLSE